MFPVNFSYLQRMKLNIQLAYVKSLLHWFYFFYPIWYSFETQFASPSTLGLMYALSHLLTVILELPTGALADLIGRRKTILIGLLLTGFGWIVVGLAQNSIYIWLGYLVNGVGIAFYSGADTALHFDSLKELGQEKRFGRFNSRVYLIGRISMIIGTMFGGYLYLMNQRLPYIIPGVLIMVSGLLTILNTEPKIDTEQFNWVNYVKQTKQGLKEVFKTSHIRDLSLFYLLVGGITWYFVYFINVPYAAELGFNDVEKSWLLTAAYIFIALVVYGVTHSPLYTKRNMVIIFPLIMVIGFISALFTSKYVAIVPFLFLQLTGSARATLLDQFLNDEFVSKYRATAVSTLNMMVSLVFAIIMISGGFIIELFNTRVMMGLLGIMTLICVLPLTTRLLSFTKHD